MYFAAIAQQVERILGKDEVPSSNLGSSSKRKASPSGLAFCLAKRIRFESNIEVPGGDFGEPVQKPVSTLDSESG